MHSSERCSIDRRCVRARRISSCPANRWAFPGARGAVSADADPCDSRIGWAGNHCIARHANQRIRGHLHRGANAISISAAVLLSKPFVYPLCSPARVRAKPQRGISCNANDAPPRASRRDGVGCGVAGQARRPGRVSDPSPASTTRPRRGAEEATHPLALLAGTSAGMREMSRCSAAFQSALESLPRVYAYRWGPPLLAATLGSPRDTYIHRRGGAGAMPEAWCG